MMISQWFNPRNLNHIRAYDHLQRTGVWPEKFLPEGIAFDPHWQYMIMSNITEVYIDDMLANNRE